MKQKLIVLQKESETAYTGQKNRNT